MAGIVAYTAPTAAQAQPPAPGTPSSVTLSRADGTVTATWPASEHATSYHVTYSSNGKASWQLAALDHPAVEGENSITIEGADNAKTYFVAVRARNETGGSGWRNSPAAGPWSPPQQTPAPGTPSSVTLSRADGTVTAVWPAAAHAASYHVTYSSNGKASWQLAALDHPAVEGDNTITIDGADNDATYIVAVRARNETSGSGWRNSAAAGPYTPPAPAPETPSSVTLSRADGTVTATWPAVAHATSYHVTYSTNGKASWQLAALDHPAVEGDNTITIDGADNDATYIVAVRARNQTGGSGWRNSAAAGPYTPLTQLVVGAAVPTAPDAPSLTAGAQQITVTWDAPSSGGTIDDYDVRWRQTGTSEWSGHWEGGSYKSHHILGCCGTDEETVDADDPLDNGTVGISTVARESVGGLAGVYKLNSAVDSMLIKFYNLTWINTSGWSKIPTLDLRAASTKPTASNLGTHGTSLDTDAFKSGDNPQWEINVTTSTQLSAGSYLWFVSDGEIKFRRRYFELSNIDLATTGRTKTITGLTDGTAYEVQVRAGNADGEGAWSASGTATAGSVPSTPGAPAVASRNTSLAVSWTAPAANDPGGITDYDVQYSSDGGTTWTEWSPGTSTATSTTITGLTNGTAYDVQVRAANAVGESKWSASASTRPGLPDPAAKPAVTPGTYQLAVSWTAPATNGTAITDYDVQYSSDGGTSWTEWNASDTSTATSATITGLTYDTAYLVQVRAVSSAGDGPWSPSTSTRTRPRVPAAPAVPALVSGDSALTAAWTASADNGFSIVDYDVRYCSVSCTTDSNWTVLLDVETSDPGTVSQDRSNGPEGEPLDLTPAGFNHGFASVTVEEKSGDQRGLYKLGASVAGLRIRVTGKQTGSPTNPPAVRARHASTEPAQTDNQTDNLATFGTEIWSASPGNSTFSADGWSLPLPANSYFWVAADADSRFQNVDGYFQIRAASTATSRVVTGLTNGTTYEVQVRAANVKGYSDWSPSATIVAGMPNAVASPELEAAAAQLRVNWTAPSDNGSAITDYDLQYRQGTAGAWTAVEHSGTGRTATISSLTAGRQYQVRVRASNPRGAGPWSAASVATVGAPAPPAAPSLASGNAELTATWSAPANHGSAITGYDVQYRTAVTGTWTDASHSGTSTSATISGLTNAAAYDVQVRAANARGDGAWSPSATDKPGRPQQSPSPTLTTAAERQMTATWTATPTNGAAITDYDVAYRLTGSDTWSDWSHAGTGLSATITGLTPAKSYEVRVRASSAAGQGAWSSTASATTLTSAPEAPAAPLLSAGATSLSATWAAPSNNGSAITGYTVEYRRQGVSIWTAWAHTGTAVTANVTGLTSSTTYEVRVKAVNVRGSSGWSATAAALTGAPAQIGAPTLVASAGRLAVTWTAPSDNGATIDDYDVRYRRAGTSSWTVYDGGYYQTPTVFNTLDTVDGPSGDPLDNGIPNLTTISRESIGANAGIYKINDSIDELVLYFYSLANVNGSTTMELRHSASKPGASNLHTLGTVLASATPTGTSGLQAFVIDTTTAPLSASSYFWLESSSSLSIWQRIFRLGVDLASTGTSHTVTGLTHGAAYEVQVRAGNSRGDGSWSPSTKATLPSAPSAPLTPALTPGDASMGVDWDAPAANGTPITDFDLRYSSDDGATWTPWKPGTTSTATSDTITGLTNGSAYQVQVRAGNAVGDSGWSPSATATPQATTVQLPAPGAPGAITAARTSGTATVSWTAPGGPYLRYQLRYREVTGDTWVPNASHPAQGWHSVTGTQSATSATITSWDDTKTYVVAVRARSHVTGLFGSWGVSDLLAPVGAPPRVGDIEVTRPSAGQMSVTWDKLSAASVHSYETAWSENTTPRSWQTAVTKTAASCAATTCTQTFSVHATKEYVVRVRSVTSTNTSSHWVVSSLSRPLDIENLSATRVLAGNDPSYVEQRPLDVVVTWDALPASANVSYRVRMQYRTGDPAQYYDTTDTNTNPDAKPDHWNMDWQWYSFCNDDDASTNPPGSRGCNDPFTGTAPYLRPLWEFAPPRWSDVATVNASSCASTCSHTFADSTVRGLTVKVQVWAVNSSNSIGPTATYTTSPARPPGRPLSVTAVAPSGASAQVQWEQAYDGGSPVIGFDVNLFRYDTATGAWVEHASADGTKGTPVPDANRDPRAKPTLTLTFHDVPTNARYYAAVRAQNIEGYSNWRVMHKDLALAPTKPPPPAPPIVAISGTTATVTWMAPADDGGSAVSGYLVQYRKKSAGGIWSDTWTSHSYTGSVCTGSAACSTTVTVDADSAADDYQFRVAATNSIAVGDDQYSSNGSPGAPSGVTATAIAGGVSVTWTQPADIGTSAIVAADIRVRTSASPKGAWSQAQTPATNPGISPARITGLTAGTAYDVQVRVRNANGASVWVDAGTVTPTQ